MSLILSPCSHPSLLADAMSLLSPSMIITKRSEESGKPCRRPLSAWKKCDVDPLMRKLKAAEVIQHMI